MKHCLVANRWSVNRYMHFYMNRWSEQHCVFHQLSFTIAGGSSSWQRNTTSCLLIWTPRPPVPKTTITCCDAKWTSLNSSHPEEAHQSSCPVEYLGFWFYYFTWSYTISEILLLPHLQIKTVFCVPARVSSGVNLSTWTYNTHNV